MRDTSGDEIEVRVCHGVIELTVYDHTLVEETDPTNALAELTPDLAKELAQNLWSAAQEVEESAGA